MKEGKRDGVRERLRREKDIVSITVKTSHMHTYMHARTIMYHTQLIIVTCATHSMVPIHEPILIFQHFKNIYPMFSDAEV